MKRVCCRCGLYLGEKEGPEDAVSHGFCEPCKKAWRDESLDALAKINDKDDNGVTLTEAVQP